MSEEDLEVLAQVDRHVQFRVWDQMLTQVEPGVRLEVFNHVEIKMRIAVWDQVAMQVWNEVMERV